LDKGLLEGFDLAGHVKASVSRERAEHGLSE